MHSSVRRLREKPPHRARQPVPTWALQQAVHTCSDTRRPGCTQQCPEYCKPTVETTAQKESLQNMTAH